MRVPPEIVRCRSLSANALALADVLWDSVPRVPKDPGMLWPYCFYTLKQLAHAVNLSEDQAQRAMKQLVLAGFVDRHRHPTNVNLWRSKLLVTVRSDPKVSRYEHWLSRRDGEGPSEMVETAEPAESNELAELNMVGRWEGGPPRDDDDDVVPPDAPALDGYVCGVIAMSDHRAARESSSSEDAADVALRIANAERAALKIAPHPDTASQRKSIVGVVAECESEKEDPRPEELRDTMTMAAFVGHMLAAMACAHVKGAKKKPQLADGHQANAVGLRSRMRQAKVRDGLLEAGREHARLGGPEGPAVKEQRKVASGVGRLTPGNC